MKPARLILCILGLCSLASAVPASDLHGSSGNELFDQGQTLVQQGRLAEAEAALDRAESISPNDSRILTLLGKVKGRLGQFPEATALFQRVIQLSPHSADAHVNLAIVLSDSGALPSALEETGKAIAIDPNLASAHLTRARVLDDLKRWPEAKAEFAVACRLAPDDPDGYFYWSLVEREERNYAHETALLERVVKLQPQDDKTYVLLAKSLMHQSRRSEAIPAMRHALAINPKSAEAMWMLSRALVTSDPEESKRLQEQFAALHKESATEDRSKALGNEAYRSFLAQDWTKAIQLFREALQMCGDCEVQATLHRNLGLVLCRAGNVEEGTSELRRALALNPNDRDAVKALAMLGQ